MDHRGLLAEAGQYPGALQQCIVEDECRPHMYEYASFMHIESTWERATAQPRYLIKREVGPYQPRRDNGMLWLKICSARD